MCRGRGEDVGSVQDQVKESQVAVPLREGAHSGRSNPGPGGRGRHEVTDRRVPDPRNFPVQPQTPALPQAIPGQDESGPQRRHNLLQLLDVGANPGQTGGKKR